MKNIKIPPIIGEEIDFENLAFLSLWRVAATKGGIGAIAYELADAIRYLQIYRNLPVVQNCSMSIHVQNYRPSAMGRWLRPADFSTNGGVHSPVTDKQIHRHLAPPEVAFSFYLAWIKQAHQQVQAKFHCNLQYPPS